MSASVPRHILVPHDFSATASHALDFAIDLAAKLGARVTIMHAYEVPVLSYPDGVPLATDLAGDISRAAGNALEGIAGRARRPGVDLAAVLERGAPWAAIEACAREIHADLIVMGTHGRRGLTRALLGSVAEKVVRTAPCPVLTVRGPA